MSIDDRRARERAHRRAEIVRAAWVVAESGGWGSFSLERVAAQAELGRATLYGYFDSLEALVVVLAEDALEQLRERLRSAKGLAESLDAPVRFAQQGPAAFALLFPPILDARPVFSNARLDAVRVEARKLIGSLQRLSASSKASLPADAQSAAAFVAGISLAGAVVPELRQNTPLRRRWQDFCLGGSDEPDKPKDD